MRFLAGLSKTYVFDATVMPPKYKTSVKTRSKVEWVTIGLDGKYVFPSSGDVIDATTKKVIAELKDEFGRNIHSEKQISVLFVNGKPTGAVDRFGLGRMVGPGTN